MSILFYDHLIEKTEIHVHIDTLPVPEEKKSHLKQVVDDILHNGLLEYILEKLHPHHHHTFLSHLEKAPYDPEIIKYLKSKINDNIETDLKTKAKEILKLVKKDLTSTDA